MENVTTPINQLFISSELSSIAPRQDGWYRPTDFMRFLRTEREGVHYMGLPVTFVSIDISRSSLARGMVSINEYKRAFVELISHINRGTRKADVKCVTDDCQIQIILINIRMGNAKKYVERIAGSLRNHFNADDHGRFHDLIDSILITSHHRPGSIKADGAGPKTDQKSIEFAVASRSNNSTFFRTRQDTSREEIVGEDSSDILRWTDVSAPKISKRSRIYNFLIRNISNRLTWAYPVLKIIIDKIGATAALLLLSPLLLSIALLVKLSSKGPVLYRQSRIGYKGEAFTMLKFRSMYQTSSTQVHKDFVTEFVKGNLEVGEEDEEGNPVFKLTDDERITSIGRFLRKTSLDEFPQFLNVLGGSMSLVGPRPSLPYEVECYSDWHRQRVNDVKPGVTGMWQVYGRNKTTFDEMVHLDIQYIRHRSIYLDLKLILKTAGILFDKKSGM